MRSAALFIALVAALALPVASGATTIRVSPGQSIQAAVDVAAPGDTVLVRPGTYTEPGRPCPTEPGNTCAVVVTKDGISLIARPSAKRPVVLARSGDQDEGIAVGKTSDPACLTTPSMRIEGALVSGFTVSGFEDDGVFLFCVDRWRVTATRATGDAEYGIFPSHVGAGRVDHSFASGANDTGIYVGQAHDVRVDHNTATVNVSGFEIENSARVRADHNLATANTGGILSFTLPFLDVKANDSNLIDHNIVAANNKPNTCLHPEDTVCRVQAGTGVLILAADRNRAAHNRVTGNDSFGIGVANFCVAFGLTAAECAALDIDPNPDGNHIVSNHVTANGMHPDPSLPPELAVDLAWDTTGTGNCWSRNVFGTGFPPALPACPPASHGSAGRLGPALERGVHQREAGLIGTFKSTRLAGARGIRMAWLGSGTTASAGSQWMAESE